LIAEMLVSVKSVPAEVDSVEHVMASSPVTVKVMVVDVEVDGLAANVTVGAVVSMTRALFAPSELAALGEASVSVALLPAASRMVPELRASEVVPT
jgi:uncharacterized membrane protein